MYACITTLSRMTRRVLYVYHGEGADENAREELYSSLQQAVCPKSHSVEYIHPEDIIKAEWTSDAALLAIGGGYDLGLIRALGDDGIGVIRNYVGEGGSYLGLCSGGYFACDHIEFDKNGPLEVCGERHLKFFPGLCIGPVFPGFQYKSFVGAVAAPTDFWDAQVHKTTSFHAYFNGGGFFQPYKQAMAITTDLIQNPLHTDISSMAKECDITHSTPSSDNSAKEDNSHTDDFANGDKTDSFSAHGVEILAKFSSVEGSPASIVKTKFGNGVTILSGSHVEYNVDNFPKGDPYVEAMMGDLRKGEEARKQCFVSILKHLQISCTDSY